MSLGFKMYTLAIALINGSICACTPTIKIWYYPYLTPQILALSHIITTAIGLVVTKAIQYKKSKMVMVKGFYGLIVMDIVGTIIANIYGIHHPVFRFIFYTINDALVTDVWLLLLNDAFNYNFKQHSLTKAKAKAMFFRIIGGLIGSFIAFLAGDTMTLELAIIISTTLIVIATVLIGFAWSKLNNKRVMRKRLQEMQEEKR